MENKTTRTNKNDLFKINWSEKVMQLDETIRKEIGKDQAYLAFGNTFERTFIGQSRDENRDIGQSLDRGWRLLAGLPESALMRISLEERKKYVDPAVDRKSVV